MKTIIDANKRSDFIFRNFSDLNAQRVVSIALPFLALNSKTAVLSSVGMGFYQCYTLWNTTPNKTTTGSKWADAVLLVSSAALGTFFPKHQLILSSGVFFSTHLYKLLAGDNKPTTVLQIIHQAIHLSSIYHKTPAWIVLSLLSQASQELVQAYKQGKKNSVPEMIASLLLAAIRLHKASSYIPAKLGPSNTTRIEPQQQNHLDKSEVSISTTGASATLTNGSILPNPNNTSLREMTNSEWENFCNNLPTSDSKTRIQLYTLLKAQGFSHVLRDIDFTKKSLWTNISFEGLSCHNCNFSNVHFKSVLFSNFTASNCNFNGSTLNFVEIFASKFIACDFTNLSNKSHLVSRANTFENCIGKINLLGAPAFTTPKLESPPSAEEVPDEFEGVERTFKNPACPFTDFDHELNGDLDAKIEAKRFKITGPDQREIDFGSYFHGFGKSLVKGANIHFRKIVFGNGAKGVELSFRVNDVYHKRLRQIIKGFDKMNEQERRDFARQFQSRGMKVDRSANFSLGQLAIIPEHDQDEPDQPSAYEVSLESFGSLTVGTKQWHNLKDQVKITLNEGATLESFHHFLSIFGLEDALKKSTEDDLEKIKLGILFRTFFPSQASVLEKDGTFFDLSPQELKQKIVENIPKMEKIFNEYTVEKRELFPGYFKMGVAVAKKTHELGARALTTALTGLNEDEPLDLGQVVAILKNGLLSQELREKNGINVFGINEQEHYMMGGSLSIFTSMITQTDLSKNKKVDSFFYDSPVRLYISLDALNQGSYQYLYDNYGTREQLLYRTRFTIIQFIKRWPSFFRRHEIMIPDRVLPEFIKAMSVQSEEVKQQILAQMRLENLLKVDQNGQETFNDIPVDEFIHTEDHLTPELVKHCSPQ